MGGGFSHFKEAKFPATKPPMFGMSLTGRAGSLKETMLLTYCPRDALSVIQSTITGKLFFCRRLSWKYGVLAME